MTAIERQPSRLARMARALGIGRARNGEQKAGSSAPLIAVEGLGMPAWMPRDYSAFAREGMMKNPIVYRSIRMISEAAASVPLLLYEGEHEIEEHPLLDLLRRPGFGRTSTDLLEAWYGYLLVAGNAYAEVVASGGKLRELHVLRPDRVRIIPGEDGWPEEFEYSAGGRKVRIGGEVLPGGGRILHMKLFHPVNDHYGLSPIEAAATAIDLHNAASRWNKSLPDTS